MAKPITAIVIGAGNRGCDTYSMLTKQFELSLQIVGVVEPDDDRRARMQRKFDLDEDKIFSSVDDAFKVPKLCNAVIIATPDKTHYEIALKAIKAGYHVLLEKPMATTPEECIKIVKAAEEANRVLFIAHVLRYAPFFQRLKKIIDSKKLGDLLHINLSEQIGYWHFAHSYVRGNWRRKDKSGPVTLTKCSHDFDILSWFLGRCTSISSNGRLKEFRIENAPESAPERCTDGCPVANTCIYNAEKQYLHDKDSKNVRWPTFVISLNKTIAARKKAIREGPYGRCVYKCDNDVCDTQTATLKFSNGATANFDLNAHTSRMTRLIHLIFTRGEVRGNFAEERITTIKFNGFRGGDEYEQINIDAPKVGHGGGEIILLKDFVQAIRNQTRSKNLTTARASLHGHILAFAAEQSRMDHKTIDIGSYQADIEGRL